MHNEITDKDRIESVIKKTKADYTYFMGDFMYQDGSFLYWNVEGVSQPSQEEISAEEVTKICPETCIECVLQRIKILEDIVKDLRDELD